MVEVNTYEQCHTERHGGDTAVISDVNAHGFGLPLEYTGSVKVMLWRPVASSLLLPIYYNQLQ